MNFYNTKYIYKKKTGEINARIPQLHSEWESERDKEKH